MFTTVEEVRENLFSIYSRVNNCKSNSYEKTIIHSPDPLKKI